jgi:hypothetical protein
MSDLRPCWCGGLNFWRSRDGAVHCAHCRPAAAHYIIAERLRALPISLTALERAMRFLQAKIGDRKVLPARSLIVAAGRIGIAPATFTRARWRLGFRSVKTRQGWLWFRPQ